MKSLKYRSTVVQEVDNPIDLEPYDLIFVDKRVKQLHSIPGKSGYPSKNLSGVKDVVSVLDKSNVREGSLVLVIGGAHLQDVCSFALGIYHGGVAWDFMPTTIVAMSDSCIGGFATLHSRDTDNVLKINHAPQNVFIDYKFIDTLPAIEKLAGLGEIIRTRFLQGLTQPVDEPTPDLIWENLLLRVEVLSQPGRTKEFGFGHDFGAPFEDAVPHGVAVLHGMDIAAYVSYKLGYVTRRFNNLFSPGEPPISLERYMNSICRYKRWYPSGLSRIILPVDPKGVRTYYCHIRDITKLVEEYYANSSHPDS